MICYCAQKGNIIFSYINELLINIFQQIPCFVRDNSSFFHYIRLVTVKRDALSLMILLDLMILRIYNMYIR